MSNPFDYINNVSTTTNSIWTDESPKDYNAFMINRGLSQYRDTVLFAQVMDQFGAYISPKMQYDFYRLGISHKKKRFAKWHKPEKLADVEALALHFGINKRTMENYVSLMSETDYDSLLNTLDRGGRHGSKK